MSWIESVVSLQVCKVDRTSDCSPRYRYEVRGYDSEGKVVNLQVSDSKYSEMRDHMRTLAQRVKEKTGRECEIISKLITIQASQEEITRILAEREHRVWSSRERVLRNSRVYANSH